jgi:hypothetical protein
MLELNARSSRTDLPEPLDFPERRLDLSERRLRMVLRQLDVDDLVVGELRGGGDHGLDETHGLGCA